MTTNKIKYSAYIDEREADLLDKLCYEYHCTKSKAIGILLREWADSNTKPKKADSKNLTEVSISEQELANKVEELVKAEVSKVSKNLAVKTEEIESKLEAVLKDQNNFQQQILELKKLIENKSSDTEDTLKAHPNKSEIKNKNDEQNNQTQSKMKKHKPEINNFSFTPITGKQLGERLSIESTRPDKVIGDKFKKLTREEFIEWTQEKDPNNVGWYREKTRGAKYYPIKD